MQHGLGRRQYGDQNGQHLKQDIRRLIEDLKNMQESNTQDRAKPDAKITKKQSDEMV
jgi:hypothetical protein